MDLPYKVNGSANLTAKALVRTRSGIRHCGEPATQHGLGIVGDIGERSDAHPVCESESNSTYPQRCHSPLIVEDVWLLVPEKMRFFPMPPELT